MSCRQAVVVFSRMKLEELAAIHGQATVFQIFSQSSLQTLTHSPCRGQVTCPRSHHGVSKCQSYGSHPGCLIKAHSPNRSDRLVHFQVCVLKLRIRNKLIRGKNKIWYFFAPTPPTPSSCMHSINTCFS